MRFWSFLKFPEIKTLKFRIKVPRTRYVQRDSGVYEVDENVKEDLEFDLMEASLVVDGVEFEVKNLVRDTMELFVGSIKEKFSKEEKQ